MRKFHTHFLASTLLACLIWSSAEADADNTALLASIDTRSTQYATLAKDIWELAELGYQETRSSELLQGQLKRAGFRINSRTLDYFKEQVNP